MKNTFNSTCPCCTFPDTLNKTLTGRQRCGGMSDACWDTKLLSHCWMPQQGYLTQRKEIRCHPVCKHCLEKKTHTDGVTPTGDDSACY